MVPSNCVRTLPTRPFRAREVAVSSGTCRPTGVTAERRSVGPITLGEGARHLAGGDGMNATLFLRMASVILFLSTAGHSRGGLKK